MISTVFICWLCVNFGFLYGLLDDRLRYYETLHHDLLRHRVTKRDVTKERHSRILEYDSHKRHFRLVLHKDTDVLSTDFKAIVINEHGRQQYVDVEGEFYHGFDESDASGTTATAYWESGTLISAAVETSSDVYVLEPSRYHLPPSNNYTLIAYRSSDITTTGREMRCGNSLQDTRASTSHIVTDVRRRRSSDRRHHPCDNYAGDTSCRHVHKQYCPLLLVADHRLHRALGHDRPSSTVHHLINQIMRVNDIFTQQTFGNCGRGFGFQIKKVIVHEKPTVGYNSASYDWKDHVLLNRFIKDNREHLPDYCLSHLFTAVPLQDGVMGLAALGALCNPNESVGLTTYMRTSTEMAFTQEAVLITAHELGHNWGSNHDHSSECVPSGSDGGKYLMYPITVNGLDRNNKYLSSCSRLAIERCLMKLSSRCFQEKLQMNCGNYQVDDGEECDEVPTNIDVNCCNTSTCRLHSHAVCSDQSSSCCHQCKIADSSKVCYDAARDCREITYCNGKSQHCPEPQLKPNGDPCYRGRCFNGECKTLCEYHNLTSCLCDRVEDSCKWCCMNTSTDDHTCRPYQLTDNSTLPDRTPCVQGYCLEGVCKRRQARTIRRILEWFRIIGDFEKFMRDNIVGTVMVLSLVIWIPLVWVFHRIERRQKSREAERDKWLASDNKQLISQEDQNRIKIIQSKSVRHRTQ